MDRIVWVFRVYRGSRLKVKPLHVSYSLNSLKGGYIGDHIGDYYRAY